MRLPASYVLRQRVSGEEGVTLAGSVHRSLSQDVAYIDLMSASVFTAFLYLCPLRFAYQ